jgi:DNA repair exonuclease SbcCD ATPase subunit
MWIWWLVSLLILTASIVFSLYIFYGSYKAGPVKKDTFRKSFDFVKRSVPVSKQQLIASLRLKLQAVENNSALYYNELKKLQQRIQALEKNKSAGPGKAAYEEEENWEELYYKASDDKVKLENELDLANQKLEETEELVLELKRRESNWKEKRSELENELNKAHTLQNRIGSLQQELEGAAAREKELQQQLDAQYAVTKDYENIQQQYAFVQSEADELRNRLKEITNRDLLLQEKINRLTRHESSHEISAYEKMDIRKSIEEIIAENEAIAARLQKLQEKLNAGRYA